MIIKRYFVTAPSGVHPGGALCNKRTRAGLSAALGVRLEAKGQRWLWRISS
jgi:hypothetical protein